MGNGPDSNMKNSHFYCNKKLNEKSTLLIILDNITDLIESVFASVFLVILLFTFVFKIATVEGPSMQPTLETGHKLVVSDLFYKPHTDDIVIINSSSIGKLIVKRIIAVGGQTVNIDFEKRIVYVDGKVLDEPYLNDENNNLRWPNTGEFKEYPVTVPDGYVFVLGDNRRDSKDSRFIGVGFISEKELIGKALFRVYPFESVGVVK